MKRMTWYRALLLMLCLSILMLAAACAPTPTTTASAAGTTAAGTTAATTAATTAGTTVAQKVVTLTGFSMYGSNDASAAAWYEKYLAEKLGIKLQFQAATGNATQMMQALMASGALPDIVGFNDKAMAQQAAQAGLLLSLDDNKAKLPNVYGSNDLYKYAINFYRDNVSNDTHKLFVLPTNVGVQDYINYDPQLRWDIYKKAGSPKINVLEDYLPALKAMVDAYPQTEDGKKTYGISLFPSWDSNQLANAVYVSVWYGTDSSYSSMIMETMVDGSGTPISLLDNSSQYLRVINLYYKANQMGILDPDSATQTWDIITEKWGQGRIMFSPWAWSVSKFNVPANTNADNFKGYASVWPADVKMPIYPDQYVGGTWSLAISSATKNVDAALKFYDFYYSMVGQDMIMNGPQGVLWDVDSSGLRYITAKGWDILENQGGKMPDGGTLAAALAVINAPSCAKQTPNSAAKNLPLQYVYWESSVKHNTSKLLVDWQKATGGFMNAFTKAKAEGKVMKSSQAVNMVPAASDDMKAKVKQIGDVIKTSSWKLVYAKNDAEYASILAKAQSDIKGLGNDEYMTWFKKTWAETLATTKKYAP